MSKRMFGVLNVAKPAGVTSRHVVDRVSRLCPRKCKVGHAGTLDPMATGVLVVALGPATKLIQYVQRSRKTYVADFRLGLKSDTEDITGEVEPVPGCHQISESGLRESLERFTGTILQTPPAYSAVKVNGKRAYKAARQGQTLEIQPRPTQVHALTLREFQYPDFRLEISCGKGTYVRTLGRDIARSLGSDAVMTALQRTGIGRFSIDSALELTDIENRPLESLLHDALTMVGDLPRVQLSNAEVEELRHGRRLASTHWNLSQSDREVAATSSLNELVAVIEKTTDSEFKPKINFVPQLY